MVDPAVWVWEMAMYWVPPLALNQWSFWMANSTLSTDLQLRRSDGIAKWKALCCRPWLEE